MSCFHHIFPPKNAFDRTFDPEKGFEHSCNRSRQTRKAGRSQVDSPQLRKDKLYTVTMTAEQCCWKCGRRTKVSSNEAPAGFPLTSPSGLNAQALFDFCLSFSSIWIYAVTYLVLQNYFRSMFSFFINCDHSSVFVSRVYQLKCS